MPNCIFNRQQFASMLKQAMGTRSINQFALHSGVSAAYISKILRHLVPAPPSPAIIAKLSGKAYNRITYVDLMEAAGYLTADEKIQQDDANMVKECRSTYPLDLADYLSQPHVRYKNKPLDEDTRRLLEAFLDKIHAAHIKSN